MRADEKYDKFIKMGARVNLILYTLPIAVIVLFLHHINVDNSYILEVLIIYLIGAISHMLAYGFQALNAQIDFSVTNNSNKRK